MTTAQSLQDLLARLAVVHRLCPEMRFGQLIATVGLLAEDETGRNLWDIEDEEFAVAVERFAADLSRREQVPAQTNGSAGESQRQGPERSRGV